MLLVTFEATVSPDDRDAVLVLAQRATPPTLAEPGCVTYQLLARVDAPNRLMWVEQWRDADAFAEHQASPHIQAFLEGANPLMSDPRLVMHTVSGSEEVPLG